jgi:hypothetical protein
MDDTLFNQGFIGVVETGPTLGATNPAARARLALVLI